MRSAPVLRSALASRKSRTSARNAASSGRSSKSILLLPRCLDRADQPVLPETRAAQLKAQRLGAAVIEMAVELPGDAHAAMGLDVLLRRLVIGLARRHPRGRRGHRQLGRARLQRPGAVVAMGAGQFERDINIGELVLDRLERADRPAEGIALQRVVPRHVEAGLGAADLLEGEKDRCTVERALYVAPSPFAQRMARRIIEAEGGLAAGAVEGLDGMPLDAASRQ